MDHKLSRLSSGAGREGILSPCAADVAALRHLAEAERYLEECSSCLVRDVIVSKAQAAEHNRSIVDAKNALSTLREGLTRSHEEISGHFQEAQLRFLQTRPLISLATGYIGVSERQELDLSTLEYRWSQQ